MNTHTTVPPETPVAASRSSGPGSQLRQARLDLKLTPENVAHILHLSPRQIVALENDDYVNLPGPTYVRGYLRGYAQLLGLSAEPIVEAYSRSIAASKLARTSERGATGSSSEAIASSSSAIKLALSTSSSCNGLGSLICNS